MKLDIVFENINLQILKYPYLKDDLIKLKDILSKHKAFQTNTTEEIFESIKNDGIISLHHLGSLCNHTCNSSDYVLLQKNINDTSKHYEIAKIIQDNYEYLLIDDEAIIDFNKYVKMLSKIYINTLIEMETKFVPNLIKNINEAKNNRNDIEMIINANKLIEYYKKSNDELSNAMTELHQAISLYCKKYNISKVVFNSYCNKNTIEVHKHDNDKHKVIPLSRHQSQKNWLTRYYQEK